MRTPPDDTTAPDPRPASMRRRVDFDTTPEAIPTAPVTAEDLRSRLIAKVRTVYDESCAAFAVDTVLAELAGDPGDLPAQDVERHLERRIAAQQATIGRQSDEVERLRAELAEAKTGRERYAVATGNWTASSIEQRERAEKAEAERDLLRETLAESDLGAQVLAQWEAIAAADADRDRLQAELTHAQWAIGQLMDDGDVNELMRPVVAERDALKAAVERVERYLDGVQGHRSANQMDTPSWIGSIRAALAAPETTTERTDLIAAYAVHLRPAGDRADAAEAAIERIRIAFVLMRAGMPDGPRTERDHGVVNVMETVEDCLAAPESNEDAEKGNDDA